MRNNIPTATKLNQKPACNKAHGSHTLTTTAASNHCSSKGQRNVFTRSQQAAINMMTVRCAGTPQPLNKAYTSANNTPPHNAACDAGYTRHHDLPQTSL